MQQCDHWSRCPLSSTHQRGATFPLGSFLSRPALGHSSTAALPQWHGSSVSTMAAWPWSHTPSEAHPTNLPLAKATWACAPNPMAAAAQVRRVMVGQQVVSCPKESNQATSMNAPPVAANLSQVEGHPPLQLTSPPPAPAAPHVTTDVQERVLRSAHNAGNPVSIHVIVGEFLWVCFRT